MLFTLTLRERGFLCRGLICVTLTLALSLKGEGIFVSGDSCTGDHLMKPS